MRTSGNIAVDATNNDDIHDWAVDVAAGANGALAGQVVVSALSGSTTAYVSNATLGDADHRIAGLDVHALGGATVRQRSGAMGGGWSLLSGGVAAGVDRRLEPRHGGRFEPRDQAP